MSFIQIRPNTEQKLRILSQDAQYDLACACATREDQHRQRSSEGKWIYPVVLPGGGYTYLFKTLLSNECVSDCRYCPLRGELDSQRCALTPEELAKKFMSYYRAGRVSGLFLSSAINRDADTTMERINRTALLLRRQQFRGYIHLKIIPGASDAAIRRSLALASAVSINIEVPGEHNFRRLTQLKQYQRDILHPLRLISRLRHQHHYLSRLKHTTQFVVGASTESDKEIIDACGSLYNESGLNRIYFSAYQRGLGSPQLPGECSSLSNNQLLLREHRLYQADWLIRKYGFNYDEIPLKADGNISLTEDPKQTWAGMHPDFFPVNVNKGSKEKLLRVPGLGLTLVERILNLRRDKTTIYSLDKLTRQKALVRKAAPYISY
jgi:predicted DNA-binding helix-hairpin-helix protein